MDFKTCPKIELHLHMDCSLSYQVVHTIDSSISLEDYQQNFIAPAKCTNLADFLTRAPRAIALMQTKERLQLVVADLFEQLQQDGVIYAEIRFAPFLHTEHGLSAEEVVEVVNATTAEASRDSGIEARLILCTLRHFTSEQSMQTVKLVEQFRGTHVAALDIAGDEAGFPLDAHVAAFQYAVQHNLARTAHAGEGSGPESVWETLRRLQPTRIGHGVRSIEDTALLDELRAKQIHLEVCPSSNIQTNMYETYADHPINKLYNNGISIGVNTDARTITSVTLAQEYERLFATFGWDKEHLLRCNLAALEASFLETKRKLALEEQLRAGYGSFITE
jgi:adenosine deaminase